MARNITGAQYDAMLQKQAEDTVKNGSLETLIHLRNYGQTTRRAEILEEIAKWTRNLEGNDNWVKSIEVQIALRKSTPQGEQ